MSLLKLKLHLYPNRIRRIGFGSQNNSPSLTLLIEGIIVGLIIVIKLNIQYALRNICGVASSYDI